ncbi:hypothetical protein ABEP12_01890 [Bacillus velezensis]
MHISFELNAHTCFIIFIIIAIGSVIAYLFTQRELCLGIMLVSCFMAALCGLCGVFIGFSNSVDGFVDNVEKILDDADKEEKAEREEILKKGIETEALIVDKEVFKSNDAGSISIMPFVVGSTIYSMPISSPGSSSTSYGLRIYAEDKNYDITVPERLYERKQVGSRLKVKVYKEKIELLENEK